MSRRTIRVQRSPNASTAALIGHPDRGSPGSPIVLAIYYRWVVACAKRLQTTSGMRPMLRQVAEGVLIHQSEFMQTNAVVVQGREGVLLIDPGVLEDEMTCLANDLRELGETVAVGFS